MNKPGLLPTISFGGLGALAFLACFFYAGWWWDAERPSNWPYLNVHIWFYHHTFSWPDGYGTKYRALLAKEATAGAAVKPLVQQQKAITATTDSQVSKILVQTKIQYQTIVKEVPTYVTPAMDRSFPLSVGFVRVLDAGALGLDVAAVPGPAGLADDTASPIAPSDAAKTLVGNDEICRQTQQMVLGWQSWYTEQRSAWDKARAAH